MGLPFRSTARRVGFAPVSASVPIAFVEFHWLKYRKMPKRAQGVYTMKLSRDRVRFELMSNNPKKNVLFRIMGPPKLTVSCWVFVQLGSRALPSVLLLLHVFGSNAVLRKLHTALPEYRFVPERVEYWMDPLPRPSSTSTGARISRISPTRSGLIVVIE